MVKIISLGLSEQLGVFILGLLEEEPGSDSISLSHCVRMYELADPADPRRVGFTWHPDPFLTSEKPTSFFRSKILCVRELEESEEMAAKYRSFLTEFRLRRSGLVSGVNSVDQQRKIITEGV